VTWTDIGLNLPPVAWATVSDIAVDPDDADRLWVGFNGYGPVSNNSIQGLNRVYFSMNGGATWTDFTKNLLAFPISCLIYQRGSDDVLFAGTDVGVFRYNNSSQTWECFNNFLPAVPVTRLEINYCKNKIRAATFGRGVYESDLPALPSETVNAPVTWTGVRYLSNDLTVSPGATLTLKGTLYMSKGKRVIVQRGATLLIDGGTITNACGDMWYGIELWGTRSVAQTQTAAQGRVLLQNNARIENAVAAITTGKDVNTTIDPNYAGGVVQAISAFFYNNQTSVRCLFYHWMTQSNLSYFKNCTFETNRRLNDATLLPIAHVSLNDVRGVALLGCKFNNTAPTTIFSADHRGVGIDSADAVYTVDNLTSGGSLTAASSFSGLTHGVRAAFPTATTVNVKVSNSDFNNVQRGVQIFGSKGSSVVGNTFNALPNAASSGLTNATWGARVEYAANLLVKDNSVTGANTALQNNYGIIIDNCGNWPNNLVQGNTLKNLYTGILVRGQNGSGANGVQFRCNTFQPSMTYQLSVATGGILANQGSACTLGHTADNTFFAQATPPGAQINAPNSSFTYHASGTVPTNVTASVTVNNCSSTVSGECP
jgi:hypothetical protein